MLGELLVEDGLITTDELEDALAAQAECGKRLGEVLVERKLVSGPELTAALMKQFGVEMTKQDGFGAGLWGEIKRRHRETRVAEAGPPAGYEFMPKRDGEPLPDNLVVLDRLLGTESEPTAEEETRTNATDAPATSSEAAAFAARPAEADEALTLESAYREDAERDLETLLAELQSQKSRIADLERESAEESELHAELDALTVRLAEADEMIAREAEPREAAEREAAEAATALSELRNELDTACARLSDAESVDASAPARVAELEGELERAIAESTRAASALSSLTAEAERLAGLLADSDEALVREAALRQEVAVDLDRLRADEAGRDERLADLARQVTDATAELTEERSRYASSEEERAATAHALTQEKLARERVQAELIELRDELNALAAQLAEAQTMDAPLEEAHADYLVFVAGAAGYELSQRTGAPPEHGVVTELDGVAFRVVKIGRSPLPEDRRRCAYLVAA